MSAAIIVIVVVVVVVVVLLSAAMAMARRRRLKQRFGPEYDRVVEEKHGQLRGEAELAGRQRRVQRLDIRPLSATARATYAGEWTAVQEQFVDQPESAVAEAQLLVVAVMRDRGYPTDDYEQIAADLSVEHAGTLDHYRAAQHITASADAGDASTEDLRQAMVHYRALFSELLGPADDSGTYETDNTSTFPAGQETATAEPEAEEYQPFGGPADESGEATASRSRRR